MVRFKDILIDKWNDLYYEALGDGVTEEEATAYADTHAEQAAQDYIEDWADAQYEAQKDRFMED